MRRAGTALAAMALIAAGAGCDPDELPRSDIRILRINGGDALQSDVLNFGEDRMSGGGDDFIPEDEIFVTFLNTPSDAQGPSSPVGAFSDVTMTRYRITFSSTETIDGYVAGMHALVRSGDTSGVGIVAVPAEVKMRSPLVELRAGGEILSTAHLEFWGHEKTSGDSIYVEGYMGVTFAQFGDEN